MNLERFASVGIALLCMSAIGIAATTYDSTVSQSPDDIIDFNNKKLPFGDSSTSDVDKQIQKNKQSQGNSEGPSNQEQGNQDVKRKSDKGQKDDTWSSDDSGSPKLVNKPDDSGTGMGPGSFQSLLDRLLALLKKLLPFLIALVVLALAYRYRERLFALLLAPLALFESGSSGGRGRREHDPWESVDPSDDVDRAWYAMVRRTDIDRPWARTPDECRAAAVEAGLDPDAVGTLTQLFREKRYSGKEPSDAHLEGARRCFDQLDLGRRTL